jgi:hypothetical protein
MHDTKVLHRIAGYLGALTLAQAMCVVVLNCTKTSANQFALTPTKS